MNERFPYPCGKSKFQIVRAEGIVCDGRLETFIQEILVAIDEFCDSKPETEKLVREERHTSASH
jgi:hypothetical protein